MSAIVPAVILRLFLILLLSFAVLSCKETVQNPHGLKNIPISAYTYKGLVEKSIQLKFKSSGSSTTTITAEVEIPFNYKSPLRYQWKLGDQVVLSNGQLKGEVTSLEQNKIVEISIDVTGFKSDTARFIRFEIIGTNPQRKIYADGIYSSDVSSSFESIVREVENYKSYHSKDSK